MKIQINTVEKTIVLLETTTFQDLEQVKLFIGLEDLDNWTITGQTITINKVIEKKEWYPFNFPNTIPAAPGWPFNQPYYNDPLYGPFKVTCDVNYSAAGNNHIAPTSFLIERNGTGSKQQ